MKWPKHIFFLGLILFGFFQQTHSQSLLDQEISLDFDFGTREQFIDSIISRCGVRFLYTDLIHPHKEESILKGKYSVKQLLDSIFVSEPIDYLLEDDLIILSPIPKPKVRSEKLIIQGSVVAKRDKKIPFATIYLKNTSKGTISNADGEFKLIIPEEYQQDTLMVSSLGYLPKEILPNQFHTEKLIINLEPAYIPIRDVIVRPQNPELIIKQSLDKINVNYPTNTELLTAFFRESSKQNNDYISITEALIEISKTSYDIENDDLIRLVKGRNGTNTNQSDLVNLVVEGGLYNGLRLDVVKYGSYFYSEDALQECDFQLLKTTVYNGRHTYVIEFDMKKGLQYSGFRGKVYIDLESLALVRAEFELSPEGIRYAKALLIKKSPMGYKVKPMYAKYEVEYRYYSDLWNLHYARSDLGIKVKKIRGKRNKGYSCDFNSAAEFVITDQVKDPSLKIRAREASKPRDILVKQVQDTQGDFWFESNVIVPEEPLSKTILKMQEEGILMNDNSELNQVEK